MKPENTDRNGSPFEEVIQKRLLFVLGKGGVGKSVISQALAWYRTQVTTNLPPLEKSDGQKISGRESPVLHLSFEDPVLPSDTLQEISSRLFSLNASAQNSFEEYIQLKLRLPKVASVLLKNKLIRYLAHATPGVKEVVLLGKAWAERMNYQQVICDMPATGHGLAMFSSVKNFTDLFRDSVISSDANEMLDTFSNPKKTGFLIVSLPEEMPLKESVELADTLKQLFPKNPPAFLVNKIFPDPFEGSSERRSEKELPSDPMSWTSPLAAHSNDYVQKRFLREEWNLGAWKKQNFPYYKVPFFPDRLSTNSPSPGKKSNQNMEIDSVDSAQFDRLVRKIGEYFHHLLSRPIQNVTGLKFQGRSTNKPQQRQVP